MSGPGKGDKRGYSWPPFEDGHTRSTLHGARSERRVGPLADEIRDQLLAGEGTPEHLHRPEFASAVAAWARSEAVVRLLWDWLAEQDVEAALTDTTRSAEVEETTKNITRRRSMSRRVTSVLDQLHRAEVRAAGMRRALGLDPLSAGRLARDLSQSRWYQGVSPLDRALAEIQAERDRQAAIEAGDGGG